MGAQSGQTEGDPNLDHRPKPKTENPYTQKASGAAADSAGPDDEGLVLEPVCSWNLFGGALGFPFGVSPGFRRVVANHGFSMV